MSGAPSACYDSAAPLVDVSESILARRRVPCLCPRQHEGACGVPLDYSTTRGIVLERVECERCPRTWTRINAE